MGTASILPVTAPEEATLAHWKAITDAAQAIKYLHENPQAVDAVTQKIQSAHELKDDAKAARQEVIDEVAQNQSTLDFLNKQVSDAEGEAENIIAQANADAKKIRDAADSYKKLQEAEVKKRWDALDVYKGELDDREIAVAEREEETATLEADKKSHSKGVQDFENEKAEWEQEFSKRFAKLSAVEQSRFKV